MVSLAQVTGLALLSQTIQTDHKQGGGEGEGQRTNSSS